MHTERYRKTERYDAAGCPGFEPLETPHGTGCRNCSGLPEDHANVKSKPQPEEATITQPKPELNRPTHQPTFF
jgi:hypothetical protein